VSIPEIESYSLSRLPAPPPSRVGWQPAPARAALLIHDMQDYFLRGYRATVEPGTELIRNISALRSACRASGVPVFYSAQPPASSREERGLLQDMWGSGLAAMPELQNIAPELAPTHGDVVLTKHRYSAFHGTELFERLRAAKLDQLWICGVYAHIGCMLTACSAFMHDIQPFLVSDAVADFSLHYHQLALDYVSKRCGVVVPTAEVVAKMGATDASSTGRVQRRKPQERLRP
jgi:bifunctional isochorismate lyase/aryl carrier protein